jgi:hypothetical protein
MCRFCRRLDGKREEEEEKKGKGEEVGGLRRLRLRLTGWFPRGLITWLRLRLRVVAEELRLRCG